MRPQVRLHHADGFPHLKASDTRIGVTEAFADSVILVTDRHVSFHNRFFRQFTNLKLGGTFIFSIIQVTC